MMASSSPVRVARLRVRADLRAAALGAPAVRSRLERQIAPAALQPPGLPEGAVLLVRSLAVTATLPPRGTAASRWTAALQQEISRLYRTAARPALGPVPAHATSVRFADEGELLACWTRDVLQGSAGERWYWQRLLGAAPPHRPGTALAGAWASRAAWLPAAFTLLTPDEAGAAVALLDDGEIAAVLEALRVAFALPAAPPVRAAASAPAAAPDQPPWWRWLPPRPAAAPRPLAAYLLGLARTLSQAPGWARAAAFTAAADAWLATAAAPRRVPPGPLQPASPARRAAAPPPPETRRQTGPAGTRRARGAATQASAAPRRTAAVDGGGPGPAAAVDGSSLAGPRAAGATVPPRAPPPGAGTAPGGGAPPAAGAGRTPLRLASALLGSDVGRGATWRWPDEDLPTELGGVLYLVHLLDWLGLPHSWADGALAAHLGGWAIVDALARGLLGPAFARYARDPLWPALAALDRREPGTPLGTALPPFAAFRLPAAWLAPRSTAAWTVAHGGGRVQVGDRAGPYLVADVPLAGRPARAVARAEAAAYRAAGLKLAWRSGEAVAVAPLARQAAAGLSSAAAWWTARLTGFVHWRLARALGMAPAPPGGLVRELLARRGRLVVSRTHVDLVLPMDAISLAVRRAGLDRDPGWVPDLGRIVLFHFG
ncbi:MAG TPA: hypothetical protein VII06_35290 [Chloroflexota bacterium]|jgi:hypothetical protein